MYKLGNNAAYQGLKDAICQVTRWVFGKNGICMDKIEWIERQLKKYHLSDSLSHFLADMLLIIAGIIVLLLLFQMGYGQGWVYLLGGVVLFFIGRRLFGLLAQKPQIAKVTRVKSFISNTTFILLVGNLLLVVAGLYLALYGIRITAEGNAMNSTSDELSYLNTWITEYHRLIYLLFGMFVGGLLLLVAQIVIGIFKKEGENRDIGAINKQMSDELKKIKDKENEKRRNNKK